MWRRKVVISRCRSDEEDNGQHEHDDNETGNCLLLRYMLSKSKILAFLVLSRNRCPSSFQEY